MTDEAQGKHGVWSMAVANCVFYICAAAVLVVGLLIADRCEAGRHEERMRGIRPIEEAR